MQSWRTAKSVSGAHGEVLVGSGRPVTADTPFLIGSISKSFTAMAVMKLAEAEKIELGAPVSRYLDVFKDRPSGAITIRQLLSHTSGFSTKQGNDTQIDRSQSGDELQRQVERIAEWSPAHAPDARWQYSNANYQILGAVIEQVSGQDFASYIEAEILEPIGMDESFVSDGQSHDCDGGRTSALVRFQAPARATPAQIASTRRRAASSPPPRIWRCILPS